MMGNQQSGSGGGGGKDKGEQKEKKKYEPPVPTRYLRLLDCFSPGFSKIYFQKCISGLVRSVSV